jgi:hypothetical protein
MADERDIPEEPMRVGSEQHPRYPEAHETHGIENTTSPLHNNAVTDSMRGNYNNTGGTQQEPTIGAVGAGENNMQGSVQPTGTSGKRPMNV